MRIRVSDVLINLFLIGIRGRSWGGVSDFPEFFDELFAGVVGGQAQECIVLFFCNDIGDVPFEPISVAPFELLFLLSGANRD